MTTTELTELTTRAANFRKLAAETPKESLLRGVYLGLARKCERRYRTAIMARYERTGWGREKRSWGRGCCNSPAPWDSPF